MKWNRATYNTIDAMWLEASRRVLEDGIFLDSRDGGCHEILGYSATLSNVDATFLLNPVRKLSPIYASAELLWYLASRNEIEMIKAYAPQYERFAEDGKAFGAYGWRWREDISFRGAHADLDCKLVGKAAGTQVSAVIQLLMDKPETRQAVITMWNAGDLLHAILGDHKDLPCTLALQFFIRQRQLHCVATMRSNDLWLGMPYDIYCFTSLQWIIAHSLGLTPGTYTHNVGSLHIYERNRAKMREATASQWEAKKHGWNWERSAKVSTSVWEAVLHEETTRKLSGGGLVTDLPPRYNDVISDSLYLCASKWIGIDPTLVSSHALRSAYIDHLGRNRSSR